MVPGESDIPIGPSGLHETDVPFLAKHLDIPSDIIIDMEIDSQIKEIDGFILEIMQEREWSDTNESYMDIYNEITNNLGIHENTDSLTKLSKLTEGVKLLKSQNSHRRMLEEIKQQIINLK